MQDAKCTGTWKGPLFLLCIKRGFANGFYQKWSQKSVILVPPIGLLRPKKQKTFLIFCFLALPLRSKNLLKMFNCSCMMHEALKVRTQSNLSLYWITDSLIGFTGIIPDNTSLNPFLSVSTTFIILAELEPFILGRFYFTKNLNAIFSSK